MNKQDEENLQSEGDETVGMQKLVTSLAIALFGGGGLLLGLIGTGLFYEACRNEGMLGQLKFRVDATVSNSLLLGSPFIVTLTVLLFLIVFESLRTNAQADWIYFVFPSFTFLAVFVIWMTKDFMFHGEFGWTGFLHGGLIGGIAAFSHGTCLDFRRVHQSIGSLIKLPHKSEKDKDVKLKQLELEHNTIQTTLNWIVTGSIVFLTAAVAGYYFSPIGYSPGDPIIGIRLLNLFIGAFWASIGIIFGVIMNNLKKMQFIRGQMRNLLSETPQKRTRTKPKKTDRNRGETLE